MEAIYKVTWLISTRLMSFLSIWFLATWIEYFLDVDITEALLILLVSGIFLAFFTILIIYGFDAVKKEYEKTKFTRRRGK